MMTMSDTKVRILLELGRGKYILACRNDFNLATKWVSWKFGGALGLFVIPICQFNGTCKGWRLTKGIWSLISDSCDDYSDEVCDLCKVDLELQFFCERLKTLDHCGSLNSYCKHHILSNFFLHNFLVFQYTIFPSILATGFGIC